MHVVRIRIATENHINATVWSNLTIKVYAFPSPSMIKELGRLTKRLEAAEEKNVPL